MKRRRRASEAERSANGVLDLPSIAFSAPPRRPISVAAAIGLDAPREVARADRGRRLLDPPERAQAGARSARGRAASAAAITPAVTSTSIHLSWSSVVSRLVQRHAQDQRRVGERHRARDRRKRVAALIGRHRRAARAAVARRAEALRDRAALGRSRPRAGASRRPGADPSPGRISTYMPGVSTPNWRGSRAAHRRAGRARRPSCSSASGVEHVRVESSELSTRWKSCERSAV